MFVYKPEKESVFKGEVALEMPTYLERLEMAEGFDVSEDAEHSDKMKAMKETIKVVSERCKKVDLKLRTDEKVKITSFDDLSRTEEGSALINDLGRMMVKGYSLGKT